MDVHCNGLSLHHGGTQSVSPLHVRFSNLVGCATEWFEEGVMSMAQFQEKEVSNDLKVEHRREVFSTLCSMYLSIEG